MVGGLFWKGKVNLMKMHKVGYRVETSLAVPEILQLSVSHSDRFLLLFFFLKINSNLEEMFQGLCICLLPNSPSQCFIQICLSN